MSLTEDLEQLKIQVEKELQNVTVLAELEAKEVEVLGKRQGRFTKLLKAITKVPLEERKQAGKTGNLVKRQLTKAFREAREVMEKKELEFIDPTLPGTLAKRGTIHPLTKIIDDTVQIFKLLGFQVFEGPDIEYDSYNFQKLNIPKDHPARDMQDTFYLDKAQEVLLRTHTSPGQVRFMEKNKPPMRILVPGVVYRRDAVDATHLHQFYQIEGLMVDEKTSFSDLKGVVEHWASNMFGENIKLKIYPHFFPFTEPSIEVEINWGGKWLEVMGAGMVHPNVLKASGINPAKYQGWAFGMGMERIAMIKYGIGDIRLFYQNDLRFLKQF